MDTELCDIKMALFMKESFIILYLMAKAYITALQKVGFMKESFLVDNNMVKDIFAFHQEKNIKVDFWMVVFMVMVYILFLTVMFMKVNFL